MKCLSQVYILNCWSPIDRIMWKVIEPLGGEVQLGDEFLGSSCESDSLVSLSVFSLLFGHLRYEQAVAKCFHYHRGHDCYSFSVTMDCIVSNHEPKYTSLSVAFLMYDYNTTKVKYHLIFGAQFVSRQYDCKFWLC